jgi:carboxylesterase type B
MSILQSPRHQRRHLKSTARRRSSALSDSVRFRATSADTKPAEQAHNFLKLSLPTMNIPVGVSATSLDDPPIIPQTGAEPDASNGL